MTETIKIAERIAQALTGYHTPEGRYGHWLLAARAWHKEGKCRVYIDKRFVEGGKIDTRVMGAGYIDFVSGGIVYACRDIEPAIRATVQAALTREG